MLAIRHLLVQYRLYKSQCIHLYGDGWWDFGGLFLYATAFLSNIYETSDAFSAQLTFLLGLNFKLRLNASVSTLAAK